MRSTPMRRSSFHPAGAICNGGAGRQHSSRGTRLAISEPVTSVGAGGPRRRILVVDDDVDAAEALGELLRDCGHDVATAHDGPQALDRARVDRPEVVLLDITMPEMDGDEVSKRMPCELGLGASFLFAVTGNGR